MMTKFVPVDDALVLRFGSVQGYRDRLEASMEADELPKTKKVAELPKKVGGVLASIRDLFPAARKVPTIREAFVS